MSTGSRFKALLNLRLRFLRWLSSFNKPKAKRVSRRGNGWLYVTKK